MQIDFIISEVGSALVVITGDDVVYLRTNFVNSFLTTCMVMNSVSFSFETGTHGYLMKYALRFMVVEV